jgi:hypothetical protein
MVLHTCQNRDKVFVREHGSFGVSSGSARVAESEALIRLNFYLRQRGAAACFQYFTELVNLKSLGSEFISLSLSQGIEGYDIF